MAYISACIEIRLSRISFLPREWHHFSHKGQALKRKRPHSFLHVAFIIAGNDLLSHTLSRAVQSAPRGLNFCSRVGLGCGIISPVNRGRKRRIPTPIDIAALVLFYSDRTCCVCRRQDRRLIQIHHIDDNPSNNAFSNLAVLCHECHADTQVSGGFHRRLDAAQVRLYRNEWIASVGRQSVAASPEAPYGRRRGTLYYNDAERVKLLNEEGNFTLLAMIHHELGDLEQRDRYIEKALHSEKSFEMELYLRSLQGTVHLIPEGVVAAHIAELQRRGNWSQLGRAYLKLSRWKDAAFAFCRYALESVEDRPFSAAIYLKEMVAGGVITRLFEVALADAQRKRDLWWQHRSLQELERFEEADELLLQNAKAIKASNDEFLKRSLVGAEGRRGQSR